MLGITSSNMLSVYEQKNFMTVLIINSISEQKQETVDQGMALEYRKNPLDKYILLLALVVVLKKFRICL